MTAKRRLRRIAQWLRSALGYGQARLTRSRSGALALLVGRGPTYAMLEVASDGVSLLYSERRHGGRTWAWGWP